MQGDGSGHAALKEGLEVKSRDIGAAISSPSKRKSKKKSEAASAQALSSVEARTLTVEQSPLLNYKLILGVALVSVIVGVILGKIY